jgi:benzoyl-CoA reductase/2-hydroxyglutaryl-CoA dehydratase subunit BcrC/BadD/HgdB
VIELLKMCGFEADEVDKELPRIKKAFTKLGITARDIERGKQRLTKYYDIELEGVRKIFRLCVLELVNSVLAKEERKSKVIFGFMAPGFETIGSALVSKSKEVLATHQSWAFFLIFGCIFDKIVPVLEAAEERWLKTGMVAHCANVKSLLGMFVLDLMPKPDLLVTSGFLCETAPKTIDMLHELYEIPVCCCYDTCQDREYENYTAATERIFRLEAKSLRKVVNRIQEVVGFKITDDMIREVLDARSELGDATRRVRELIASSDPLPISATHETLLMLINTLILSLDKLPEAINAMNTLYKELQERVSKGFGVVEKGSPRILALLPTHHSDPRLEYLIGKLGIAIVAADVGAAKNIAAPEDPYERIALASLQGDLSHSSQRRLSLLVEGCKRLNVDGVLDRFHVGCRAVVGDAYIINDALSKEIGIPILLLEWENFDPRVYNREQYTWTFEMFKTILNNSREYRYSTK